MAHVLVVYGKDDILGYVYGTLEEADEKQEIESLVQNDPKAAKFVTRIETGYLKREKNIDFSAVRRLHKLKNLAKDAGLLN